MSKNAPGPREQQLRAMREQKLQEPKRPPKLKVVAPVNESVHVPSEKKEEDMAKKKVKAKKGNGGARKGSKSAVIERLLMRSEGCTSAEVLKATKWPTISMPAIAKQLGLRLRRDASGDVMRYYGSR